MSEPPSNKFWLASFYLSESIQKIHFDVRHPVFMNDRRNLNVEQILVVFIRLNKGFEKKEQTKKISVNSRITLLAY
jgi:hypothetical protein